MIRAESAPSRASAPSAPTATGSRPADGRQAPELAAAQAALAAEHAAVYGYGVVGGRVSDKRQQEAREAYDAHRARRDALQRAIRDLGGKPEPAAAGYTLPFEVPDGPAAVRLAAELEARISAVYADLVRSSTGARRRDAAAALREAAVRVVRWRGSGKTFPGLTEHDPATRPGASDQSS